MNKIWTFFVVVSIVALLFSSPELVVSEMTNTAWDVCVLCAQLLAVYAIWMGLLEIVDATGLGQKLARLLSPLIRWLFKTKDEEATKYIALNMSANMLGLGNASTPMGIKAMQKLDDGSGKITSAMIMLLIVNSTSIQFLPTTVVGLRTTAGSLTPTDIIFPTLISTTLTFLFGIFSAKLCEKLKTRKKC